MGSTARAVGLEGTGGDGATFVDVLARSCAHHADVVAATGVGPTLTYAELWARGTALARDLVTRGVGVEDRVGLWATQDTDLVVGMLGILAAGAAYVPLDPTYPWPRLEGIVADAGLSRVVVPTRATAVAAPLGLEVVDATATSGGDRVALPRVEDHHAAYVVYTSGSTGAPKGVVVEHRSLVDFLAWMRELVPTSPGDRFCGTASPSFDASAVFVHFPLTVGGTYVALDADVVRDPYLLADALAQTRPRAALALPAMLRMLVETGWRGDDRLDLWTGGERTAPDVIRAVVPTVRSLRNWYGPTEATVAVASALLGPDDVDSPVGTGPSTSRCVLLDDERRAVAPGEVGEVYVTGSSLARGYLHDDALTASRFVTVELEGVAQRAYRTGDLGRVRADGALVILGRTDDQINLRGYRVEPGDVEAALSTHPDVVDAAVLPRVGADGDATLVAFVTARGVVDPGDVRAFARGVLPDHMVPTTVRVLAALPVAPSGKVDRQALSAAALAEDEADHHVAASPLTPTQRVVTEAFAVVLGLATPTIGLDDDFFDLGGTSLKSVRLFLALEDRVGVALPLSVLASSSTPRTLAAVLDARHGRAGHVEAPQHEWERILSALWRDTLGLGHLARTDSFFALGGTEADAARMLDELRARYGVDVSVGELREAPSVEALAAIVGARSSKPVLVPLTTGGSAPPLFLIAGAGGLAITFLPLARLLGADQPCYGLQAQGIERRAVPDLTLAAGARRYLRAIRDVQPHGPYLLGGHSLGGVHALKVAQRLDAAGEEVALLALFDTPLSASMVGRRTARETLDGHTSDGTAEKGVPKLSTVLHLPVVGVVPLRGTAQFEAFAALGELQATFARRLGTWSGRTTLFLSDEDEAPVIEARWGGVLTGPWTSARVPGGHVAMLERANVAVAATILREQIARSLGTVVPRRPPTAAPSAAG